MNKRNEIMELSLPIEEAADMVARAGAAGVPTHEYLGIQAMAGAYGHNYPPVVAFRNRPSA